MKYWYVPGMYYPYWWMDEHFAGNQDADTDMGNLCHQEFHKHFSHAIEITQDQYDDEAIDPNWALEEVRRKRLLDAQNGNVMESEGCPNEGPEEI